MRGRPVIGELPIVTLVVILLTGCAGGRQEDPLAKQIEITAYLGMECVKSSALSQSLQFAGVKNFEIDPNSRSGKALTKLGFSLKAESAYFLSPDEKGMTIRHPDKLVVPIPNEWRTPFGIKMQGDLQLPEVEFKDGEIVWHYAKSAVSIKSGTFARIKATEYQFLSGRWVRSAQENK